MGDHPQIMILGTMPSVAFLAQSFYYAHPHNAFGPIMQQYFGKTLNSVADKQSLFVGKHLALWDVLKGCEREGSLDSAIVSPEANNFEQLFQEHPQLNWILFNGKTAEALFKKHVIKSQNLPDSIQLFCMPLTSPANAIMNFESKYQKWSEVFDQIFAKLN